MNKLMGFLELKEMNIPSISWKEFSKDTVLGENALWTVRTAVYKGSDHNLPRKVGVDAKEAMLFGRQMLDRLNGKGMVIYYPYFIADKSGTLNVSSEKVVIEAVKADLWNMVTNSDLDVTIIHENGEVFYKGDREFLSADEQEQLMKRVPAVKRAFRDDLLEGKGALLEWSFARNCNSEKEPVGNPYLVFYEARTIKC